jgi:NAD(P)-dependent dehydrogenase (short-subunit alcohol dehydrogenase family)
VSFGIWDHTNKTTLSKAAVAGLSRNLARELGSRGITIPRPGM